MINKIKEIFSLVDKVKNIEAQLEKPKKNKEENNNDGFPFFFSYSTFGSRTIAEDVEDIKEDIEDVENDIELIMQYLGIQKNTIESVTKMVKTKKK